MMRAKRSGPLLRAAATASLASVALVLVCCVLRGFDPTALASAPGDRPRTLTLDYKTVQGDTLEIDLLPPLRPLFRRAPVVLYLHGGGWSGGSHALSAEERRTLVDPLREAGMSVASVEYRLTDADTVFPAHVEDVADAIRFLVRHADEYGLDADRICAMGGSAGAHLALLAAADDARFRRDPALADVEYRLRCVVAISTPLDFVDLSEYGPEALGEVRELLSGFLGAPYEADPALYALASPMSHVSREMPPVLLVHGEKDALVPVGQADRYVERGREVGMRIEYVRVENGDHGLHPAGGAATDPALSEVLRSLLLFLVRRLLL
jgi:acetyl esterase/lipase